MTEDDNKHETIIVAVGDTIYRISKFCPHRWGRLEYGYINEKSKTITCPLHSSTFSLITGDQQSGPPCGKIMTDIVR